MNAASPSSLRLKILVWTMTPLALLTSSCFPGPGFFKQQPTAADAVSEVKTVFKDDKVSATVSAAATVTQKLRAPEGSGIDGVELDIEPGTLQVDMAISLEESSTLVSGKTASAMGVGFGKQAGKAINLTNDKGVTELPAEAPPMTLRIPVQKSNLRLQSDTTEDGDVLVAMLRQELTNGDCYEQIFPPDVFSFEDSKIKIGVRKFGAYQPLYMPEADLARKRQAADGGAIAVTRPGCKIITKSEEKTLPPVSISSLQVTKSERALQFQAEVSGDTVESCYLVGQNSLNGQSFNQESSAPRFKVDLSESFEALSGRFLIGCNLASGREVETEFTLVELPALDFELWFEYNNRVVSGYTNIPPDQVTDCGFYAVDSRGETQEETVPDPSLYTLDFSDDPHEVDAEIYVHCKLTSTGERIQTNTAQLYLPSDPNASPSDQEPPIMTAIQFSTGAIVAGNSMQVTVSATDESRVTEMCLWIDSATVYREVFLDCYELSDLGNGSFAATITIPTYVENAFYKPVGVELADEYHNYNHMWTDPMNTTFDNTDIPLPEVEVTGATPDTTAPTLTDLVLDASSVSAGDIVTATFQASDADSGIETWHHYCLDFQALNVGDWFSTCGKMASQGGGLYTVPLEIPAWFADDTYFISYVDIGDRAGNWQGYSATNIDSVFPNTSIPVPQLTVSGGTPDTEPPSLVAVSFDQTSYEPGSYGTITITATDDISGVMPYTSSCFMIETADVMYSFSTCQDLYQVDQDTFEIGFYVPSSQMSGTYYLTSFSLEDEAYNMSSFYADTGASPITYMEALNIEVPSLTIP
jgi:hypothetical protein